MEKPVSNVWKPGQSGNPAGRERKWPDAEELQLAVDAFFNKCDLEERPYTITGLCNALDVTRQSLHVWMKRDDETADVIRRAKGRVQQYAEENLYGPRAQGAIFAMKNLCGWSDKSETAITGANGGPLQTSHELAASDRDLLQRFYKAKAKEIGFDDET